VPINDARAEIASDLDGHGSMSLRLETLMIPRLEQAGQPCGIGAHGNQRAV
jgi:hypothetical protein